MRIVVAVLKHAVALSLSQTHPVDEVLGEWRKDVASLARSCESASGFADVAQFASDIRSSQSRLYSGMPADQCNFSTLHEVLQAAFDLLSAACNVESPPCCLLHRLACGVQHGLALHKVLYLRTEPGLGRVSQTDEHQIKLR